MPKLQVFASRRGCRVLGLRSIGCAAMTSRTPLTLLIYPQGTITLLNQYRAHLAYSVTRAAGRDTANLQRNDWVCIKVRKS